MLEVAGILLPSSMLLKSFWCLVGESYFVWPFVLGEKQFLQSRGQSSCGARILPRSFA